MSDPTEIELPNVSKTAVSDIRYVTRSPDEARLLKEIADAADGAAREDCKSLSGGYRKDPTFTPLGRLAARLREMAEE